MNNENQLVLRNAEILSGSFRNFSGKAGRYNAEGERYFNVVIPNDLVDTLEAEGWNVRPMKNDDEKFFMKVKVSYRHKKPKIVMVTSKQQVLLTEEEIDVLDWEEIVSANMSINPSYYQKDDGRRGISAYLRILYVTIEDDPFEDEFSDLPIANESPAFGEVIDEEAPF